MRIAICDDSLDQLSSIRNYIETYFSTRPKWKAEICAFDNALRFLDSVEKTGGYDMVLLDICMPYMMGTDIARHIRARGDKTEIIFLTTSDEFAVDAFALKAAHYLLKPFSQAQLGEAMERALSKISDVKIKAIPVKADGGVVQMVDINDVLYIESQKHVLMLTLKTGFCTEGQRSLMRFMEELEKLSPGQFIMPYKGYIVNQKAIATIEPQQIVLRGGLRIPIPKRRYRELQNSYFDYMFPKEGGLT